MYQFTTVILFLFLSLVVSPAWAGRAGFVERRKKSNRHRSGQVIKFFIEANLLLLDNEPHNIPTPAVNLGLYQVVQGADELLKVWFVIHDSSSLLVARGP